MAENGKITVNIDHNIGRVEFYHPKGNSLPGNLLQELAEAIIEIGNNPEAHVLVLQSRGEGAFCAGASFDELIAIDDFQGGKRFFMGFALVLNAMRNCPKLIIVAVHGKTVGGGVGIASAGDYVLAHESASIKLSELTLGIGPFVVGPAIKRKIGVSAFSTLSVNANSWTPAGWAQDKGLFSEICTTYDALAQKVNALAQQLSGYSPEAMNELRQTLWEGTDHWDTLLEKRAEISSRLVLSDATKNFLEEFKRPKS